MYECNKTKRTIVDNPVKKYQDFFFKKNNTNAINEIKAGKNKKYDKKVNEDKFSDVLRK